MFRRCLLAYRAWSIGVALKRGPDRRREQILLYYQRRGWVTDFRFYPRRLEVRISDRWRWGWTGPGLLAAQITERLEES